MSIILRSLLRDPLVIRPLSRAVKRLDDDWWLDEWPSRKVRRTSPLYDSPMGLMEDISRQMASAVNRMQELVDDIDTLEELAAVGRRGAGDGGAVVRRTESGGLQLALDVADFKPDDLKIKLVDDNLVIEAESETSGKDSYRRSHFKRWFKVPEDCKVDEIKSKLTDDNRLLIDLPLTKPIKSNERSIPIEVEKKQAVTEDGTNTNQENYSVNTRQAGKK